MIAPKKKMAGNMTERFPNLTARWIAVDLPYAVFALDVDDAGIIVRAPPIAKWTIGKQWRKVTDYYERRGATVKGYLS